MTANENTRTGRHNSGATRVQNPDAQAILEYLNTVDSATLEGLAARAGLPEAHLRDLLDELQADDLITVQTGFDAVRISITDNGPDQPDVATDGGLFGLGLFDADKTDPDVDLEPEEVWCVLSNCRRRRLIRFLAAFHSEDKEHFVELSQLATALAKAQIGARASEPLSDRRHRMYITLCQTHAPLLDEYGVIEYLDRPQKLRVTDDVIGLAQILEDVDAACTGGKG